MKWHDVLDPDLTPAELITDRLPKLHRDRREQFRAFVDTDIIISVHFQDTDQRFTLALDGDEARVRQGEMIDFPQITVRGDSRHWSRAILWAAKLVEPADEQIDRYQGRLQLTAAIKNKFERFDGIFEIRVEGLADGGEPISFEVVLNDYDAPTGAPRAVLTVQWSDLEAVAYGRLDPVAAARQLGVSQAVGLAFDVGGFLMSEFDL